MRDLTPIRRPILMIGCKSFADERFVIQNLKKSIEAWRKIIRLTVRQSEKRVPISKEGCLSFLYAGGVGPTTRTFKALTFVS